MSVRLRVLFLDHTSERSGGEISMLRTLSWIDTNQFECTVALPDSGGVLARELAQIPGVQVKLLRAGSRLFAIRRKSAIATLLSRPWVLLSLFGIVSQYSRLVRAERIDVIVTNSIKADFYGSIVGAVTGRAVVWWMHDVVDRHYFPWWNRVLLRVFANVFATRILCNSRATRDALVTNGIREHLPCVMYPSPMRDSEQPRDQLSSIRDELGVSDATRLVSMIGRISPSKGQREFIEAARIVTSEEADVVFLVIGGTVFGGRDDEFEEEIIGLVNRLPNPGCVRFMGPREDVSNWIRESEIVVFPSLLPEGFGLAAAESMQLERPVVSTALGGAAELIEDGVTGLRVDAGDAGALSRAILALLRDRGFARALAERALTRVRGVVTRDNVREMEQVLRMTRASGNH